MAQGWTTCALQQVGSYLGYTGHQIKPCLIQNQTDLTDPRCELLPPATAAINILSIGASNHGGSIHASRLPTRARPYNHQNPLPFFALSVGVLKLLNYLLRAANTAQWFLKRGKDHPLEAVGFVAAPLMFLGAVAVQMFSECASKGPSEPGLQGRLPASNE
jgi:hypothetical protein